MSAFRKKAQHSKIHFVIEMRDANRHRRRCTRKFRTAVCGNLPVYKLSPSTPYISFMRIDRAKRYKPDGSIFLSICSIFGAANRWRKGQMLHTQDWLVWMDAGVKKFLQQQNWRWRLLRALLIQEQKLVLTEAV